MCTLIDTARELKRLIELGDAVLVSSGEDQSIKGLTWKSYLIFSSHEIATSAETADLYYALKTKRLPSSRGCAGITDDDCILASTLGLSIWEQYGNSLGGDQLDPS